LSRFHLSYADWSAAEYGAAARCLLAGKVAQGPHPALLAAELAQRYAPSSVYLMNFGHAAIRIALDLFRQQRPGRGEVLVPAYICPSVVETVCAAGLAVVPVPIGADLNLTAAALAGAIGEHTLAVIAPHMFGCPADIGAIERLCRERGVFLVDDAAQVAGVSHEGRLLGTFGDIGIISFAQSKTVVTGVRGSGGVLLVNNPAFDGAAADAAQHLAPPRGRLAAFIYFAWNYLWKPYTGNSGYYFERIGALLKWPPAAPRSAARIGNLDAAIARAQLNRLARLETAKIGVAEMYHGELCRIPGVGFPQYAPGRYLSRIMISLPPAVELAPFRAALARGGVETRLGYIDPVGPPAAGGETAAAARRLLGLPFSASLTATDISRICSVVRGALTSADFVSLNWTSK
jgi:dTDP-4-amino-4,6-dideoxygalactose transaminase